ncbi:MAG: AI-2E family transporter, partial [Anaerolineae bacterium]
MISIARTTILVVLTLLILVLAWMFLEPILMALLALFVSASLRPSIDRLQTRGVPGGLRVGLIYLLVALGLIGTVLLIIGPLQRDAQAFMTRLAEVYEEILTTWPNTDNALQRAIVERLPSSSFIYTVLAGQTDIPFLQSLAGIVSSIGSAVGKGVVILILSLYWSVDHVRFERLWLTSLPVAARVRTRRIWQDIEQGVGSLIRSLVAESITSALLLWV